MRAFAALALAFALASCRSPDPADQALRDYHPLASASSPCGRYELLLDAASWATEPGKSPRLALQLSFRSPEKDIFLAGPARVTDLVPPDGAEFREQGLKGFAGIDGRGGNLNFHDLEVYPTCDRLQRLRVEVRVLRVLSWREFPIARGKPGEETEFLCPPFHVGISGAEDSCSVSACCTEDLRTFPPAVRDLFGIIGHDWVAEGADMKDAAGRPLPSSGAAGSGGHTVAFYRPLLSLDAGATAPAPVAYPVRGVLRLPDRYAVEVVPFEFGDVPLTR